jgi:hypothetical protein
MAALAQRMDEWRMPTVITVRGRVRCFGSLCKVGLEARYLIYDDDACGRRAGGGGGGAVAPTGVLPSRGM